ncbi:Transposon Ty3-I Gag-Pol polyprotein [Labeo rohita]|uniref:Gypsy retrotransposon integrase-like protein 1 n=1 Tax=Labeo rohita TaxID=84645 RepID=A0ABQ8L9G5_LABRO|nr:Transposon Ty3-I Gag-Pol polyprotein [Labeo rohita]
MDSRSSLPSQWRSRNSTRMAKALAYAVVLGLDFIFFSGLQINVADQKYSFKSNPNEDYPFQPGNASVPIIPTRHQKEKIENKSVSLCLLSSVPPTKLVVFQSPSNLDEQTLIDTAVNAAHLPLEDKQQLQQILESNPQVCTLRTGRTDLLQHHIYTTQQVPIKQRPYRTTPAKQAVIKEQLEEMLSAGIVEPSHSGWASPVVLVPKKDGSLRFCVDYRKVNAITENDAYPLPNITEILESLSGASIFSTIDLNSGYWQAVLHKLEMAGLTINLKKSQFCLQKITFLGHVVSTRGISADPSKVEAIRSYPVPTNLKEVQRFLGLARWYHRFAFECLKSCLTSPPILGHPDLELPFTVYTDTSDTGLGAVLTQRKDQGFEQRFDLIIEYRKGKLNTAPDALSSIHPSCGLYTNQQEKSELPLSPAVIWEEQQKDPAITNILQALATNDSTLKDQYEVIEDTLYHKTHQSNNQVHYRVCIPVSLVPSILQHYHSNPWCGHVGIFKTYKRIHDYAFWPGMWADIRHHVKSCVKCQTLKGESQKPVGKLQQTVTTRPNEMLGVDIMGPLPRSTQQNEYLLVFVDYYSRWVEFFPLRNANAQSIALLLRKEILTRWGVPDFILSDRGAQFVSSLFQELCKKWSVKPKLTTSYHPQTNMTGRVNRTLQSMISAYVGDNHRKWDQYLPEFRFAINSAIQETIGMSPAELHMGRKLQSPMDKLLHGTNLTPDCPSYETVRHLAELQTKAMECCKKAQKKTTQEL